VKPTKRQKESRVLGWILVSIVLNLILLALFVVLLKRYQAITGEEGRLKHGLQILTSKIAVLEDLSHNVDEQAQHLFRILDQKTKQIESLVTMTEQKLSEMRKQAELLESDPEELQERQNAVKLTRAALLANKGYTPKQLADMTGLGLQECELIYTLNKDRLQFAPDALPYWLKKQLAEELMEA
jgi:hypothetical protein